LESKIKIGCLEDVPGIGPKLAARIKEKISVVD
jgi:DNA uptake protein ComE-like DNA-binding protein